jgi:hypothetical protein
MEMEEEEEEEEEGQEGLDEDVEEDDELLEWLGMARLGNSAPRRVPAPPVQQSAPRDLAGQVVSICLGVLFSSQLGLSADRSRNRLCLVWGSF